MERGWGVRERREKESDGERWGVRERRERESDGEGVGSKRKEREGE